MKLTCNRELMLKALQTVARVVPGRTTKDILRNVKMVATAEVATLIGTDSEIGLRCDCPVVAAKGGECLLPTNRVIQVLTEIEDAEVSIQIAKEGRLDIKSLKSEFNLSIEDAKDFPPVATFEENDYFVILATTLKRLIRRTIFATDAESTRYALGGIQIEIADGKAIFAATDSRRLAVDHAELAGGMGRPTTPQPAPVIPHKLMKLLAAVMPDEGEVHIALHANGIAIRGGGIMVTGLYVQGRFPDWRRVIPKNQPIQLNLVVAPFLSGIRQAMLIRQEESKAIDFVLSKGELRLCSNVADMGSTRVDLPVGYDGQKMNFSFEPTFYCEFLRALEPGSAIQLDLEDAESPALLSFGSYQCVVMPLSKN